MTRRSWLSVAIVFLCIGTAGLPAAAAKKPKGPTPASTILAFSPVCEGCREGAPTLAGNSSGQFFGVWSSDSELRAWVFDAAVEPDGVILLEDGSPTRLRNAATAADGNFLALWLHPNRVYIQRFGAGGDSVATPVLATSGTGGGDDDNGWLAVRPDGTLFLVTARTFPSPSQTEIRTQLFSSEVAPLGASAILDRTFGHGEPLTCALPGGGAVVIWLSQSEPPPFAEPPRLGIALRRVTASGQPDGTAFEIVPVGERTWSVGHTVACAPDGSFAVAWHTRLAPARTGFDVVLRLFDPQGIPLKTAFLANSSKGDQIDPALLYEPGRGWLAVWTSDNKGKSELRGRRFSLTGTPLGKEFVLRRAGKGAAVDYPALAAVGTDGGFVLGWLENNRAVGQLFKP